MPIAVDVIFWEIINCFSPVTSGSFPFGLSDSVANVVFVPLPMVSLFVCFDWKFLCAPHHLYRTAPVHLYRSGAVLYGRSGALPLRGLPHSDLITLGKSIEMLLADGRMRS